MIVKRKTALETYVVGYISKLRNAGNLRAEAPYIRKAIKMIQFAIGIPCCDDPEAIESFGRRDNVLTNAVRGILLLDPLMRNARKSYQKTIRLLERVLFDPCCYDELNASFGDLLNIGEGTIISLIGQIGQGTFTIDPFAGSPATLKLPITGPYVLNIKGVDITGFFEVILEDINGDLIGAVSVDETLPSASSSIEDITGAYTLTGES